MLSNDTTFRESVAAKSSPIKFVVFENYERERVGVPQPKQEINKGRARPPLEKRLLQIKGGGVF